MLLVRIVAPELQRADAELPDDIIGNPEKHLASACEVMLGCARVGARARATRSRGHILAIQAHDQPQLRRSRRRMESSIVVNGPAGMVCLA